MPQESVHVTTRAKKRIHKNPHPLPRGAGGRRQRTGEGLAVGSADLIGRSAVPSPKKPQTDRTGLRYLAYGAGGAHIAFCAMCAVKQPSLVCAWRLAR